jgi:hypothetical protein
MVGVSLTSSDTLPPAETGAVLEQMRWRPGANGLARSRRFQDGWLSRSSCLRNIIEYEFGGWTLFQPSMR